MRLSKRCQYGLRAVFELALRDSTRPVKTHEIAAAQDMPARFLETILNQLKHEGFVESQRGNSGGYTLALDAGRISVGDIIRTLDGPMSLGARNSPDSTENGYFCGDSAFEQLWQRVDGAISTVCDGTSLADLVEWEKVSKRQSVPDYSI